MTITDPANPQLASSDSFREHGYWDDSTLPGFIDRGADEDPDHAFVSDGEHTWTYGEFRTDLVAKILRNARRAVESAKETILEVIGRPLDDQLKLEALLGYAICGDNPAIRDRSQEFFDKTDQGRAGTHETPIREA